MNDDIDALLTDMSLPAPPGFAARLGTQRVAGFERDQSRHVVGPGLHLVGDAQQKSAAITRRDLAPRREGARGGFDRAVHVGRVASGDDRATVEATLSASGKVTATCRGEFIAVKEGHPAFHRW